MYVQFVLTMPLIKEEIYNVCTPQGRLVQRRGKRTTDMTFQKTYKESIRMKNILYCIR